MNQRTILTLRERLGSIRLRLSRVITIPQILSVAVVVTLGTASAEEFVSQPEFVQRPYLGFSVGATDLDPDSRTPSLTVGDDRDTGGSIFLGYDLTPRLALEGYYADLGAAGINFLGDEVGSIDYQVYGLSVTGYAGSSRGTDGLYRREGLLPFLRVGIGGMRNDSEQLDYRRDHTAHLSFGAGLEYGWSNGISLRAEINSYDTDAHYAGIGVLKRFGEVPSGATDRSTPAVATSLPQGEQPGYQLPFAYPVPNFAFAQYSITVQAAAKLDALAEEMKRDTTRSILITGHTDSIGTDEYNQGLSVSRAAAVRAYLTRRGIDMNRMRILGMGESQPIETNTTAAGRAANRRVEISNI